MAQIDPVGQQLNAHGLCENKLDVAEVFLNPLLLELRLGELLADELVELGEFLAVGIELKGRVLVAKHVQYSVLKDLLLTLLVDLMQLT